MQKADSMKKLLNDFADGAKRIAKGVLPTAHRACLRYNSAFGM
jgi:hypothetical protein